MRLFGDIDVAEPDLLGLRQHAQQRSPLLLNPTTIVALNRAIAVAEVDGPADALLLVDGLELDTYYLWHATRGDLLEQRTGDPTPM